MSEDSTTPTTRTHLSMWTSDGSGNQEGGLNSPHTGGGGQHHHQDGGEPDLAEHPQYFPPESKAIRVGMMERKGIDISGVVWAPRLVMLTDEHVLFARVNDPKRKVLDYVRLQDITECDTKGEDKSLDSMAFAASNADAATNNYDPRLRDRRRLEVIFRTEQDCRNCGRSYIYRSTYNDAVEWEVETDKAVKRAKQIASEQELRTKYGHSSIAMRRARTKKLVDSKEYLYFMSAIIMLAFMIDTLEVQILPASGSRDESVFFILDVVVTFLFAVDVGLNLFGKGFVEFLTVFTNWFDLAIVVVSVVGLFALGTGGSAVRVIRIVRVLKVLEHVELLAPLHRLVKSIGYCIVPMLTAFGILMVVTLVYCVLAGENLSKMHLFGSKSPEYFKDLKTALFSMHQVVTGDSWASGIVRSLFDANEEGVVMTDANIALFFVSYFIISNVLLLNVVIAVLLDEFIANVQREKDELEAKAEAEAAKRRVTGVLDPVTENLIEYQDMDDLLRRIDVIYDQLDTDKSGGLNFEEFKAGIARLPGTQKMHMTDDDFEIITQYGKFLSVKGEFNNLQFRAMMQGELFRYARRGLSNLLAQTSNMEFVQTNLTAKIKGVEEKVERSNENMNARFDNVEQTLASIVGLLNPGAGGGANVRPGAVWNDQAEEETDKSIFISGSASRSIPPNPLPWPVKEANDLQPVGSDGVGSDWPLSVVSPRALSVVSPRAPRRNMATGTASSSTRKKPVDTEAHESPTHRVRSPTHRVRSPTHQEASRSARPQASKSQPRGEKQYQKRSSSDDSYDSVQGDLIYEVGGQSEEQAGDTPSDLLALRGQRLSGHRLSPPNVYF